MRLTLVADSCTTDELRSMVLAFHQMHPSPGRVYLKVAVEGPEGWRFESDPMGSADVKDILEQYFTNLTDRTNRKLRQQKDTTS